MAHANAALTPRHRLKLARAVVEDGWTISAVEAVQVWRLTSVTLACVVTDIGIAGFTDRKSRCSVCSPIASVFDVRLQV